MDESRFSPLHFTFYIWRTPGMEVQRGSITTLDQLRNLLPVLRSFQLFTITRAADNVTLAQGRPPSPTNAPIQKLSEFS